MFLFNNQVETFVPTSNSSVPKLTHIYDTGSGTNDNGIASALEKLAGSFNSALTSASTNSIAAEREEAALNRLFQQTSADKAMKFEADQADISRQFYKDLSDTAYQRAVLDMKAAGLNPILAYTQGGASSSAVSGASGKTASGSQANIAAAKNADLSVFSAYAQMLRGIGEIVKGIGEVIPF